MKRDPAPRAFEVLVIGGSAGAIEALCVILPLLPADFPIPIAMVLHIPPNKPSYLSQVLGAHCALRVKEVDDKEPLSSGTLYIAPPDYHLLIEKGGWFSLSVADPVAFSRPSIDVLFETAADAYGATAMGLLLTGANDDGARGLARIKDTGGMAVVQSPETAAVTTMPEAALRRTTPDHVLHLEDIGSFLGHWGAALIARKQRGVHEHIGRQKHGGAQEQIGETPTGDTQGVESENREAR